MFGGCQIQVEIGMPCVCLLLQLFGFLMQVYILISEYLNLLHNADFSRLSSYKLFQFDLEYDN